MKKLILIAISALFLALVLTSCGGETIEPDTALTSFNITTPVAATGIIDQAANTITINVPFGTDLSNLVGSAGLPTGATIAPDITAGVDFSSLSVDFTVKNEDASTVYKATIVVGENPLRLALVGGPATLDDITNMEVKKAYEWALTEYGNKAGYLSFADIEADPSSISTATAIWFHYHTTWDDGNGESFALPSGAEGSALQTITDWYKAGGNLVLTTHGVPYLMNLGRVSSDLGPTVIAGNPGLAEQNPDDWGFSYQEGFFESGQFQSDNKDNALFGNLTTKDVTFEGVTYPAIMLSAPGDKKDDAVLWDFNVMVDNGALTSMKGADDPNAAKDEFQTKTSSIVRASFEWDPAANGIELATIIEWLPSGDYQGTAISIGPGAYEWDRVDGATMWLDNVSQLTKNAIDLFVE
ncbi:MAG: DUF4960 domain-containing protein [Bacteroidia bacterium]|nr:DUF4960 domain-containing protein [Bacteroidia bacterium]